MKDKNRDVKKELVACGVEHPSVVLQALARLDEDPKFRDAFEAAHAAGEGKKFIYDQITPEGPLQGWDDGNDKDDEPAGEFSRHIQEIAPKLDARQVIKLMNQRALEVAVQMLTDDQIAGQIEELVKKRLDEILALSLGFERDSFRDGYRIAHGRPTPVRAHLDVVIAKGFSKQLTKLLKGIDLERILARNAQEFAAVLKESYDEKVNELMRDRISGWAEKRAQVDVIKLLKEVATKNKKA